MRGRGTRQAPHIYKSAFTMFDFVGVTDFHGDDEESIPGGIVIQSRPRTGPGEPRRLVELDVHDHIDPASRDWVTLDENGRIVRTDEHEAAANALGMRFQAWMSKRPWDVRQERWLGLIESSLKTEAMNAEGFWEYDLDEHPFDKWGGYNEAVRVFGGEAALEEVLASLNVDVFPVPPRAGTSDDDSVRPTA
jgi:type I restriction enzyme R subunit